MFAALPAATAVSGPWLTRLTSSALHLLLCACDFAELRPPCSLAVFNANSHAFRRRLGDGVCIGRLLFCELGAGVRLFSIAMIRPVPPGRHQTAPFCSLESASCRSHHLCVRGMAGPMASAWELSSPGDDAARVSGVDWTRDSSCSANAQPQSFCVCCASAQTPRPQLRNMRHIARQ